jgi:BirA family transcriptional regulator, biotin operon repressor / biotin---[acetyl-CoA-carboxylase] ligase
MYFYPETASTNDVALELARRGEPEGTIVITDYQRDGRGRRGHTWFALPGTSILASLILRPQSNARSALPAALVVSLGLSVALSKMLDVEVGVKWPNDLMTPHGKLGGILAESVTNGEHVAHIVVGMGINVNADRESLPDGVEAASCRTLTGVEWDRAMLLADGLGSIEAYYDRFRRDGFGPLIDAYEARLTQMNRAVAFDREGERRTGRVLGVAQDGALRVALDASGAEVVLYSEIVETLP